jgi:hypothetical protein
MLCDRKPESTVIFKSQIGFTMFATLPLMQCVNNLAVKTTILTTALLRNKEEWETNPEKWEPKGIHYS